MKIEETMVAWVPRHLKSPGLVSEGDMPPGAIAVGPWPDRTGWTDPYFMTDGACMVEWRKLIKDEGEWAAVAFTFIIWNTAVGRDGIDPQDAHNAFLKIDEYAERCSPDMKGARGGGGLP